MSEETTADLRGVLMQTIHDVRTGNVDAADAREVANLAKTMIETARLDIEAFKAINEDEWGKYEIPALDMNPSQKDVIETAHKSGVKPEVIASRMRLTVDEVNEHLESLS